MNLSNLSALKKLIIPILSGIIILLCLIIFGFRFSAKDELTESKQILADEVASMRYNLKNLNNLEDQLETIKSLTDEVRERAIRPDDSAINTAYFYEFETEDLQIDMVDQRNTSDGKDAGPWRMKNFGTTLFSLRAKGSFQQVLDLAYRLRGGQELVRILNFSVTPVGEPDDKIRQISMTVEALTLQPEED